MAVREYILRHGVQSDTFVTHTHMHSPKARFAFGNLAKYTEFMHRYCSSVAAGNLHHITELPNTSAHIRIDLDLKAPCPQRTAPAGDEEEESPSSAEPLPPMYGSAEAKAVYLAMANAIRTMVNPNSPPEAISMDTLLLCMFMIKDPYLTDKGMLSHGFHMHFVNCCLGEAAAEAVHRQFQDNLRACPVFTALLERWGIEFGQAVDTAAALRNPWLMYGSSKGPSFTPYTVGGMMSFAEDGPEAVADPQEALGYTIRETQWPDGTPLDMPEDIDGIEAVLPLLLSVAFPRRTFQLHGRHAAMQHVHARPRQRPRTTLDDGSTLDAPFSAEDRAANMKLADALVPMLRASRARDYNTWSHVGWLLYTLSNGQEDGYRVFEDFSRRGGGDAFDEAGCQRLWDTARFRGMSAGSLVHLAMLDSPQEYEAWRMENTRAGTRDIVRTGFHNDVAKLLLQLYGKRYKCVSITQRLWFEFRNHRWVQTEEGTTLRAAMSGVIYDMVTEVCSQLLNDRQEIMDALGAARTDGPRVEEEEDEEEGARSGGEDSDSAGSGTGRRVRRRTHTDDGRFAAMGPDELAVELKRVKEALKRANRMQGNLKNAAFKNSVMREACELFYDDRFVSQLDRAPHLYVFENGIYDLANCIFRDGTPDDHVSTSSGIRYRPDYTIDHPDVVRVRDFLLRVFPDEPVRTYFMDFYCDVFVGGNVHKHVILWTGAGDNSKSVTQMLFEKTLGKYSIKLPTSLITGKRTQASTATPELARAGNGVRLAFLQEPDHRDSINIGCLKELSGNDSFFARALYQQGCEITPFFKLALVCNEPPGIPYSDTATWNRLRVLEFRSTFTDNAPATFEEQLAAKRFPKDRELATKLEGMAEAFAWLLLHHRHHVRGPHGAIFEPVDVREATLALKEQQDVYMQFELECVRPAEGDEYIQFQRLYEQFKIWFRDSYPHQQVPAKPEVRAAFCRMWGRPADGRNLKFYGRKMYIYQSGVGMGDE